MIGRILYPHRDWYLVIQYYLEEKIFQYAARNITQDKPIKYIAVFEGAQNVLNTVKEDPTYFVRRAKEESKYHLGFIYATPQPGAISKKIASQTNSFFVMHLLGRRGVDTSRRVNPR